MSDNAPIIFLDGQKIYLRPLDEIDVPNMTRWINAEGVRRFILRHLPFMLLQETEWMKRQASNHDDILLAIVTKSNNQHIGNIGLHKINYRSRHATLGIIIGEDNQWRKGYGTEAIFLLIRYAFLTCNLHRIDSSVIAPNIGSIRCHEKNGFRQEGILRERHFVDGHYFDEILFGLLFKEWRVRQKRIG